MDSGIASFSAGPGSVTAAGELAAVDAVTRLGVRRHPVILAAILSDLAVRAMKIAAAAYRADADLPVIQTLAGDLSRDVDRARDYARLRSLRLDVAASPRSVQALARGRASGPYLGRGFSRCFIPALGRARELARAIDAVLDRHLNLRLSLTGDEDLELAGVLADGLDHDLDRVMELARKLSELAGAGVRSGRAREQVLSISGSVRRTFALACQRCRALDRVCAQGAAGRAGVGVTQGLGQALLDGVLDDFTSADLTGASLAGADLTGVHWSRPGTTWPPGTDVKALLARSQTRPGGGVLIITRSGMTAPSQTRAPW